MAALPTPWTRVPLDGYVTGFVENWQGEAVAFGGRGQGPLVARLGVGDVLDEVVPVGSGPVTSACSYSTYEFVVGRVRPWLTTHEFDHPSSHLADCQCFGRLEDETTRDAVRLWTVCPQDNNVMVLTIREDGWLVPGHSVDGSYPTGKGLRVVGDVASAELVVRAWPEQELAVAGPLVGGDGRTAALWRYVSCERWEPWPLAEPLDAVTDLWEGAWAAGHRDLRPVLVSTSASRPGTRLLPVDLDPAHPQVLVVGSPELVALQSVDGPQLWARDGDAWTVHPLPSGRLDAAVHVRREESVDGDDVVLADDRVFVVIDHRSGTHRTR